MCCFKHRAVEGWVRRLNGCPRGARLAPWRLLQSYQVTEPPPGNRTSRKIMRTAQRIETREPALSAVEIRREIRRDPYRPVRDIASVLGVPRGCLYRTMYGAGIRISEYRTLVVCSCGQRLKPAYTTGHFRSVLHRKNKRVLGLLKRFVPYSEIGRRVGLSRERVRQIAELLSIKPPKKHKRACALERFEKSRPALAAVAEELRRKGLRVEPTRVGTHWSRRMLLVNGRRCAVTKATRNCINGLEYFQIGPCHKDAAFTLRRTPYGWLVLPKNSASNFTMFVLGRPKLNGAGGPKHDWEKFLEAWHLLAPAKRSNYTPTA
jgi:hypothetical protein